MRDKLIYILALILTIEICVSLEFHKKQEQSISAISEQNITRKAEIDKVTEEKRKLDLQINILNDEIKTLRETQKTNRGDDEPKGVRKVMEVTAYDLSYQSCQKWPDHPEYGITASGNRVSEWHTIAAGKEIPFGTKVYMPYFKDKPNKGIFVVEDRGGGVGYNRLDIYMENYADCMEFGRQDLTVWILED